MRLTNNNPHQWATCLFTALLFAPGGTLAQCWELRPEPGSLTFTGTQAGAPLTGEFREYEGRLFLNPQQPAASYLWVSVQVASIDTQLPELDRLLIGPEFLHQERWPQARLESISIAQTGSDMYQVHGSLRIRDVHRETNFDLQVQTQGDSPRLQAQGDIQRLGYQVGTGEWSDTRWVGNSVRLTADIPLVSSNPSLCETD